MLKADVLKFFGSKSATAQHLDVSPSAVTQWKDIIPENKRIGLRKSQMGN